MKFFHFIGYDQSANEQSSFAGVHSGSKLSKSKQGSSQNVSHASTVHEENIASSRSYAMNNAGRSGSHEKGHSTQAGQGGSGMMRSIADERDAAGGESSSYYHREVKEYDANDILEAIREVGAEKRYRKERELQGIAAREGRYHGSRTMESERGYRAEMIVEPEEYSKTMASGSSIDLEPDFDASSSRYDSNSYGRYGARYVLP